MDAAWELFDTKGYEETTVNEIIEKAGIAKGTFYYYFKSKDEVLNAVIERGFENQIQGLRHIVDDNSINAIEKFKKILYENEKMHSDHNGLIEYLHKKENVVMHQKSLIHSIKKYAPVISEIISQGISEKLFKTEYQLELAEFLLVGMNFLLDSSIFPWEKEEYLARMKSMEDVIETTLRAEKGSFSFMSSMAEDMYSHENPMKRGRCI